MPNQLAKENSPYLLQHAENPVAWLPWNDEALEKARTEDKPIFLSVGYAACHWCHVMAHESFEDEGTAAILNNHFISIKVDREERPDLDSIYMKAVVAMTGQGGWPMSVFLTPDGEPFYSGTYFPPERRYNMPAFTEVLGSIARLWVDDREQLLESSKKIGDYLKKQVGSGGIYGELSTNKLDQATKNLTDIYDWEFGGWGQAPKFPQPMAIEFLLRRASKGDSNSLDIAHHALRSMAKGGMYDVVGGGFSRYSVDNSWKTPHFEKMLYDNALLSLVYLHAYLLTKEPQFRRVCDETLDFVLREMIHQEGGFYSSLDADSEGVEGKYYVWTPEEINGSLKDPQDAAFFIDAYGITEAGNFEGKNILQRVSSNDELSAKFGFPVEEIPAKMVSLHKILLDMRSKRIPPGTDNKILVSWNALMMIAFAEAGRHLSNEAYTQTAKKNADFLIHNLFIEGRLLRSWRGGNAKYNAYLEDYAGLSLALLSLYQSDPNPRWYQFALRLGDDIVAHFSDSEGGFFDTRDDHESLLLRPKDLQDNAFPSGNALAVLALLQLSFYGDRTEFRAIAEKTLTTNAEQMVKYPTAFAQWLIAADFAIEPSLEIAILGKPEFPGANDLIHALWSEWHPNMVTAAAPYPPPPGSPSLLDNRPLHNESPTAYVCRQFVCKHPVNTPEELITEITSG